MDGPRRDPLLDAAAERLQRARRAAGLTQREAARRLGTTQKTIWEWENGVALPRTKLPELAALYGRSASYLLDGIEPGLDGLDGLRRDLDEVRAMIVAQGEATSAAIRELHRLLDAVVRRLDDAEKKAPPRSAATRP